MTRYVDLDKLSVVRCTKVDGHVCITHKIVTAKIGFWEVEVVTWNIKVLEVEKPGCRGLELHGLFSVQDVPSCSTSTAKQHCTVNNVN
jgi:hypothetical protein